MNLTEFPSRSWMILGSETIPRTERMITVRKRLRKYRNLIRIFLIMKAIMKRTMRRTLNMISGRK